MEFVNVSIVLHSFLTGFILSRSINDSDMYELSEPVSKSALHLTTFTFVIATGYVTLVSVVTNIGSDLLTANLAHIDVYCLFCLISGFRLSLNGIGFLAVHSSKASTVF